MEWPLLSPAKRNMVTATAATAQPHPAPKDPTDWLAEVREGLKRGKLCPYLGPGITQLAGAPVPATQAALADFLGSKVTLPKRARGNLGAAAQYIESHKHRTVVTQLVSEAFGTPVEPLPFHRWLAGLPLSMIVDTWYDGAMRAALSGRSDWGEIQGVRRSGLGDDQYYSAYDASGAACRLEIADGWKTVLYKPHGSATPAQNYLVSDSDYVEALTEIDIQTPIPRIVQTRRAGLGFVFLGCRFNDQTLRAYARQLVKRSSGPHYVVVEPGLETRNEAKLVAALGLQVFVSPLSDALGALAGGAL
jgi:hypothetical protein